MNLTAKLLLDYYIGGALHILLKPPTVLLGKLLRREHDLAACRSVTILKLLGGGSLVIAYPALAAIRQTGRQLQIVTTPSIKPFAESLGLFDKIVVIREDSLVGLAISSLHAITELFGCDAIVDWEIHSRLSTIFSLLTCARNRVGFYTNNSFWRENLSTHLIFCNVSNGIYHFYDQVARLFGSSIPEFSACSHAFRQHLGITTWPKPGSDIYRIGVASGCSGLSRERMLLTAEWVTVLQRRIFARNQTQSVEVHLFGGKADRTITKEIRSALERQIPELVIRDHAGELALTDSVRQVATMNEMVCIDSALIHFSRLLGVPTISYWGPTDPHVLARPSAHVQDDIHYEKLPCSPCVHLSHRPPCGGDNLCMRYAADPNYTGEANPIWMVK